MKIVFIGDVMLGRFVREKYENNAYDLVSDAVRSYIDNSNYVFANLESPVTNEEESDSLKFAGSEELLEQFRWVDCFSLSNNHINDFGEKGMRDTIDSLNRESIGCNGLFEDVYYPNIIEDGDTRIAIITCTDMLNYEFSGDCKYKTIRVDNPQLGQIIEEYKNKGFFIIVYAHVGSLFCRYPNPLIRDIIYGMVEKGADCIVTAHSHCLGGIDRYKNVPIFYSLGDFLMDGSSFRRRQAGVLRLDIEKNILKNWELQPIVTNNDLSVVFPSEKQKSKILKSFNDVTQCLSKNNDNYQHFYAKQYKKEMFSHSVSTLSFIYKTKGLKFFFKTFLVRSKEIIKMAHRMVFGRRNMRYDSDAVGNHKLSKKDLR